MLRFRGFRLAAVDPEQLCGVGPNGLEWHSGKARGMHPRRVIVRAGHGVWRPREWVVQPGDLEVRGWAWRGESNGKRQTILLHEPGQNGAGDAAHTAQTHPRCQLLRGERRGAVWFRCHACFGMRMIWAGQAPAWSCNCTCRRRIGSELLQCCLVRLFVVSEPVAQRLHC